MIFFIYAVRHTKRRCSQIEPQFKIEIKDAGPKSPVLNNKYTIKT